MKIMTRVDIHDKSSIENQEEEAEDELLVTARIYMAEIGDWKLAELALVTFEHYQGQ